MDNYMDENFLYIMEIVVALVEIKYRFKYRANDAL